MADGKEIRLKISLDEKGLRLDPSKAEAAGAAAGAAFAAGFNKVAAKLADGTIIPNRGGPVPNNGNAPRATIGPGGVVIPNRNATTTTSGRAQQIVGQLLGSSSPSAAGGGVSRLTGLFQLLGQAAGGAGKVISNIPGHVAKLSILLAGLGGGIYAIRSLGAAIDSLLVRPIGELGSRFVEANEASRKFELSIAGIVGQNRARQLNYMLVSGSRGQPSDVASLRATGSAFGALPGLASRLNDKDAGEQIIGLNRLVQRLASLDPAQGTNGSLIAIREVLEGGGGADAFNSLRRRFGISASTLASAAGKSVDDLKADPQRAIRALQRITDTLIPDDVIDRSGALFSVKVQKIRDALDQALVRVGDSGSFDHLVSKVGNVANQLFAALDGPRFAAQARKVSDAVERAMDSIGSSIERFLRGATGASADQPLVEVVGESIARGIDRLSKVIDNLPAIADKIGVGVGVITDNVGRLVDALTDIADATRHPEKVAGRLADYAKLRTLGYVTNTDVPALTNDAGNALVGMLDAIGRRGEATTQPTTRPTTQPTVDLNAKGNRWGAFGDLVASLDAKNSGLPNFGATLLSANAANGRLDDLTRERDKLEELAGAGRGAFASSADVVERLKAKFIEAADAFDTGLAEGRRRLALATDPQEANQLRALLQSTQRVRTQLVEAFRTAGTTAADALTDSARDFRRGLANSLVDLPLAGPAALQAAAGRSRQIDAALGKVNELGVSGGSTTVGSWKLQDQQNFWSRLSERGLGDIADQARTGNIQIGMSAAQIDAAVADRPDDREIQSNQIDFIRSQLLPAQGNILANANTALAKNPNDPLSIRDAAAATAAYAKLAAQLQNLQDSAGGLVPAFRQFGETIRGALESNVGNAIASLIKGADDLRDVLNSVANDVLNAFSQMASNQLVTALIGDLGKVQESGQSGSAGGLISVLGSAVTSYFGAGSSTTATAAMADGGVLTRPTLTLAAEAGRAEAYIPLSQTGRIPIGVSKSGEFFARLPKGRSIPAELHGASIRTFADGGIWSGRGPGHLAGGFVTTPPAQNFDVSRGEPRIFVVSDMDAAVRAGLRKHQDIVVSAVTGNIAKGGAIGKAIRR